MPLDADAPLVRLDKIDLSLDSAAGRVDILRGIDLSVGRGETISVVGPSGSGKTSLMMVIAGLERQTGGSVAIDGRDLAALDEDQLARLRLENIGIVFQNFHLVPTMTALENVAVPRELGGSAAAFAEAGAALERVGLGHRTGHYPGQLSGGEQQRVALARAFVTRPALLLADEPTGNLDGDTGNAVIDLLFSLVAEAGTTLLLVTHNPVLAARCARGLTLSDGRIAADRTAP
ncbi:MAG: ATP-binding cassette domain-containing protein [Defluviicoccus sp.]|nr:ATP-binding cassette domain-containing protein [Defluviicoccus sp.]MDE0385939.1 ATP-binding cassette domain-containing protein [Defluviicoccus sp.]